MPRNKDGHFYYAWFPTIFEADTQNLSLTQDGAYRRLIDYYMTHRAPLPTGDRALARIIGAGLEEWLAVKDQVLQFFNIVENPVGSGLMYYHHNFCDDELSLHEKRIKTAQKNGSKGGKKKARNKKATPKKPKQDNELNPLGIPEPTQPHPNGEPNTLPEHNITYSSDTKVSSNPEVAPIDFKKVIFSEGLKFLEQNTNKPPAKLRPILAKWCKDFGDAKTATAIMGAQQASAVEPISYITRILQDTPVARKGKKYAEDAPKMGARTL